MRVLYLYQTSNNKIKTEFCKTIKMKNHKDSKRIIKFSRVVWVISFCFTFFSIYTRILWFLFFVRISFLLNPTQNAIQLILKFTIIFIKMLDQNKMLHPEAIAIIKYIISNKNLVIPRYYIVLKKSNQI